MRPAVALVLLACAPRSLPAPEVAEPPPTDHVSAAGRTYVLRALRAEALGDPEEARRAWAWAVRYDPDARARQGRFLLESGDHEAAEQAFRDAIERWPDNPEALTGLAHLDARYQRPSPSLDTLLEISPCRAVFVPGDHRREAVARCRAR